MKKHVIIAFWTLLLTCCSNLPSQTARYEQANQVATQHGWTNLAIETQSFTLQAFVPIKPKKTDTLTIYIEGDGLAWVKSSIPSDNPTPINPLALKLALLDSNAAAYVARPCQFIVDHQSRNCSQKYWTSHRFAPEVILSTNQAIDQIKHKFSSTKLILVGYSGGGAVAALVATKRHDVIKLVTVAGNLDHTSWTKQKYLSPLSGSLSPADAWVDLQKIPQHHYVGGRDSIIDESIVRSYAQQFKIKDNLNINVLPAFDHYCCWESIWPSIVESHFGNINTTKPSYLERQN